MLTLQFSPFPQLETERLLLKQIGPEHAPALFEMRSNPEVMQYIDRPLAQTVNDAMALIQIIMDMQGKNEGITWGIFTKDASPLRGTIGFWRIEKQNYRAEIGYMIHPSLQGKGLMQEAIAAVLQHGFNTMKLHSVEANIKPNNTASKKLLERNGFVQEGYFRENYYFNGVFSDSAIFSLLAPK